MNIEKDDVNDVVGLWYGVIAYTAWGILPIYWKLLNVVPALEILAHRIVWSFVFVSAILCYSKSWPTVFHVIKNKRNLFFILLNGFFISINWFTYIWAVNSNQVIEASMGYFINPLVVVLLSVTVLKEKLSHWQGIAITLAATGVIILTVQYGRLPMVALIIGCSFALYGLIKKLIQVDSVTGLALETLAVIPIALTYIVTKQSQGIGSLGNIPLATLFILIGSGVATATPLLFFAKAVQKVRFSTIGFLQYLSPTISLVLGIFVFNEYFSRTHLLSFGFIWAGLVIYLLSNLGILHTQANNAMVEVVLEKDIHS